jgi:hypothetical protein
MLDATLLIDGAPRATAPTFTRRHPVTGDVMTTAAAASEAVAVAAGYAAAAAFVKWSQTGPTARRGLISRAADLLRERTNDLVAAMMNETGASEAWSRFNIHLAERHHAGSGGGHHPHCRRGPGNRQAGLSLACGTATDRRLSRHRYLPCQRSNGSRRSSGTVRRRQGERLRQIRRR